MVKARLGLEGLEAREVPATFFVNSGGDAGDSDQADSVAKTGNMIMYGGQMVQEVTLRAAIEQANAMPSSATNPHTIIVQPIAQAGDADDPPPPPNSLTVVLTVPIPDIHQFMVIDGVDRDHFTVTRDTSGGGFRFFSIANAPNTPTCAVTFKNMTIRDSGFTPAANGLQGGAFIVGGDSSAAQLTLNNVTLSHNQAKEGGAVFVTGNSELILTNALLDGNEAVGEGNEGGAVRIVGSGRMGASNSTLSNNKALGSKGGAVSLNFSAQIVLTDTDLIANQARDGGAVYASVTNPELIPVKMTGGTVACNVSTNAGGGFRLSSANAQFNGVAFTGNSSSRGGALYVGLCKAELFGCSFDQNTATLLGPKIAYNGNLFDNVWVYLDGACTGISNADRIKDTGPP